jgi:ribosomal protein S18 acetylase RimI-like enzyme
MAHHPSAPRVQPLRHQDPAVAAQIHAVLLPAYTQEGQLLGVQHFPPMQRTAADIAGSREFFIGAWLDGALAGAVSIGADDEPDQICITTLVVHPRCQRKGVARALMHEVLRRADGLVLAVATGAANAPALALYRSFGFVVYRHGVLGEDKLALVKLRRPVPQAATAANISAHDEQR